MGRFVRTPTLRRPIRGESDYHADYPWLVVTPLVFQSDVVDEAIIVPVNFRTDLASVPWPFRRVIPQDGPYTHAAILHDWLCAKRWYDSATVAKVMREAMRASSVPRWQEWMIYHGVVLFGPRWRKA